MIPVSWDEVKAYWDSIGVQRETISNKEVLAENEFYRAMCDVGLPVQEWW